MLEGLPKSDIKLGARPYRTQKARREKTESKNRARWPKERRKKKVWGEWGKAVEEDILVPTVFF